MSSLVPVDTPTYAVPDDNLVPPDDYLRHQMNIPASRMFLINKSLKVFHEKYPDRPMYDASQGDGGASLPGVPIPILERAAQAAGGAWHGLRYAIWHRYFPQSSTREVLEAEPAGGFGTRKCHCLLPVGVMRWSRHTRLCWH